MFRMLDMAEHCAQAAAPAVTFRELEPAQHSAAPSPAFMFGPSTSALAQQMFGQTATPSVGCYAISGGGIGPTGIALCDNAVFSLHATNHPPRHTANTMKRMQEAQLPERFLRGPLAALFGPSHEIYGHMLIDTLPKLWVLQASGYDLAEIQFLMPQKLAPNLRQLLYGAGIPPPQCLEYRYWDEIIRTDLLLVPTIPRRFNRLANSFATATRFWTAPFRTTPSKDTPKRIFLSRRKARASRTLTNREQIEAIATKHGFTIVHPEDLTLPEQITLFENADQICGEYGSALHNTVFAKPGTRTCALRGTQADPGFLQTNINHALDQSTGYVFGETSGEAQRQDFTIAARDFLAAMESLSVK